MSNVPIRTKLEWILKGGRSEGRIYDQFSANFVDLRIRTNSATLMSFILEYPCTLSA